MSFNANDTATLDSGIFGLPFEAKDSALSLVPVPWEVTTSYGTGASRGPAAILEASRQVDLFDIETGDVYRHGYCMDPLPAEIAELNYEMKRKAFSIVKSIEKGQTPDQKLVDEINRSSEAINQWVYKKTHEHIKSGRTVGVIGGDHSSPFGAIKAVSENVNGEFGILHIDAHADLREAYQGFQHSHASIMFNVMNSEFAPQRLVQVGIRDFSGEEYDLIQSRPKQISTFFDPVLKRRLNRGETWQNLCNEMISLLPENIYISFDIDGLMPDLCPGTGTPVPGGLSFDQATTLLATIHELGKKIVGFDLCEVAQAENAVSEWDGNVGARLLFKLCGWTMITQGLKPSRELKL